MRRNLQLRNGRAIAVRTDTAEAYTWRHQDVRYDSSEPAGKPYQLVERMPLNKEAHRKLRLESNKMDTLRALAQHQRLPNFRRYLPVYGNNWTMQIPRGAVRLHRLAEQELDKNQITSIFSRMLEFLAALEMLGLIHGNLRPQTIWVDQMTYTLTVGDWSAAVGHEHQNGGPNRDQFVYGKLKDIHESQELWFPSYFNVDQRASPHLDHFAAASCLLALAHKLWPEDDAEIFPAIMHEVLDACLEDDPNRVQPVAFHLMRWRVAMLDAYPEHPKPL